MSRASCLEKHPSDEQKSTGASFPNRSRGFVGSFQMGNIKALSFEVNNPKLSRQLKTPSL
jgi:hypothetical protein